MLLTLAISPILIALFYVYIRDKYEKEPTRLLVMGVLTGIVTTLPIIYVGNIVTLLLPIEATMMAETFFVAFVSSSLVEEGLKFVALFILIWKSPELNEKFDGIVYAVFVSLGFAFVENILYVFSRDLGGVSTAINRALFSIPGHALFGVFMGYYLTKAKYESKLKYLPLAFLGPWWVHATYNFLLIWDGFVQTILFYLFFVGILYHAKKMMKWHLEASPFKVEKVR